MWALLISGLISLVRAVALFFTIRFFNKKEQRVKTIAKTNNINEINAKEKRLVEIQKKQMKQTNELGIGRRKEDWARRNGQHIAAVASRGISLKSDVVKTFQEVSQKRLDYDIARAQEALEKYFLYLDARVELRSKQRLAGILFSENEKGIEFSNAELTTLFNLACLIPTDIGGGEELEKPWTILESKW